jgi:hypothetical protein
VSSRSLFHRSQRHCKVRRPNHAHAGPWPQIEALEDRRLLAFSPLANYAVGQSPQAIVSADFNNDHILDLAVANYSSSTVSVLLGNANGSFQPALTSVIGDPNPVSLAVGDFDGDHILDLAVAGGYGYSGDVSVLLGSDNGAGAGTGSFGAPASFGIGSTPASVAVGDFNGDGKLDLGVTSNIPYYYGYFGQANVLLGSGDGNFSGPNFTPLGFGYFTSAAVAHFDGDNIDDFATVNYYSATVSVLEGDSSGYLQGPTDFYAGNSPWSVATGDLDGDGDNDLVTANRYGNDVGALLGNGQGSFTAATNYYAVGGTPDAAILGDFDRDGKLDIAVAVSANNNVSIVRGLGNGTFDRAENFTVGSATNGDINRDGQRTVADVSALMGALADLSAYQSANPDLLAVADTTGDNMVTNADIQGLINLLANGAVQDPLPVDLAMGDFNGDGWLDVATANLNANSVSVLLNNQSWPVLPPAVSVNDATVTEGNTGTINATFTVTLSKAATVNVTVHYETAAGTATAGSDYVAASGDVVIPAGQTSGMFTVAVLGDRVAEPTESFAVNLSAPVNATIVDGQGLGTILDDEPRISINDVSKSEGNVNKTTLFTFTVTLLTAYDQPVTMSYHTVNGTATTAGNDYFAKTGTLSFAPGETTKTITIEVKGDNKKEPNETFNLDLFDNSANSLFTDFRGIGTILNGD